MIFTFYKYQGTGNDFIIIDNRNLVFPKTDYLFISKLCDRRFGIGADGLMLLEDEKNYAFKMVYFNADGKEGSMCGNGGRCISKFAIDLGIVQEKEATFIATDGDHEFALKHNMIRLKMIDVLEIQQYNQDFVLNTGSPHYIKFVENVDLDDFEQQAKNIRYNNDFKEKGINVNFISVQEDDVKIRTYERGVEAETLSCGTGNVAAALCIAKSKNIDAGSILLHTKGGTLNVYFTKKADTFVDIWLEGKAEFVFKGEIEK
jgi:diaminopimelate epimerase